MAKKELSLLDGIISAFVGIGFFFLFMFVFKFFVFALFIAVLGYLVSAFILAKEKSEINFKLSGIKEEELRRIVSEGLLKVKEMRTLSFRIKDVRVKERVDEIFNIVENIFDDFKKDPNDIKASRQFLNYYLDSTIKIIKKYIEISEQNVSSAEVKEIMNKTEKLLVTIKAAFEKQLANLLKNDLMDLNVEVDVLEKTLKMEGMGE